jgi:spore maturation protein CgeB
LERNVPWYAANRDYIPHTHSVSLYDSFSDLNQYTEKVRDADLTIVGSYVPDGINVGAWARRTAGGVCAFYDIDTPETMATLKSGTNTYITLDLVPQYDLYLSFTGGPILRMIEERLNARAARTLYCSVDPAIYFPTECEVRWDLGYMGTYSADRQQALERLLLRPAADYAGARMIVAGPQYPGSVGWPPNVSRVEHIAPGDHRVFYGSQRFTLNITRRNMRAAGFSPSVRLFEAAACGTPVITDKWAGLDSLFKSGEELLTAESSEDTLRFLKEIPERDRVAIGFQARRRVLAEHTAEHRAAQLEQYYQEACRRV